MVSSTPRADLQSRNRLTVELGPAPFCPHPTGGVGNERLSDSSSTQPTQRLTAKGFTTKFEQLAKREPGVAGNSLGLPVARRQKPNPANVDAASDFAARTSLARSHVRARLKEGTLRAFGKIVVRVERLREIAVGRREDGSLDSGANGATRFDARPELRKPQPEIAGRREERGAHRRWRHGIQPAD